jgi:hypothetical protein
MESFTPLTRRIVALGLLVLAILLGISWAVMPLITANELALKDLADVRRALARARAQVDGPEAPVVRSFPDGAAIWSADRKAASDELSGRLAGLAAGHHLDLQLLPGPQMQTAAPSPVSIGLSASGAREDVVRFINVLEAGALQIRFRRFHLSRLQVAPMAGAPPSPPPPSPGAMPGSTTPTVAAMPTRLRLDAEVVALWGGAR